MRKLGAGILVLTLAGCASTRERRPSDQAAAAKEDCTRFEAAARAYGNVFNPIKWQKLAIEDCGSGGSLNFWDRTLACMAVPGIFPFTTLVAVVGAAAVPDLIGERQHLSRMSATARARPRRLRCGRL